MHGPALELRALEPALVVADHAVGVRPCPAGVTQQLGRHLAEHRQLLGETTIGRRKTRKTANKTNMHPLRLHFA